MLSPAAALTTSDLERMRRHGMPALKRAEHGVFELSVAAFLIGFIVLRSRQRDGLVLQNG